MSTPQAFTRRIFRPSNQNPNILTTSDKIDLSSEETTRITTITDTMTTERNHNISHSDTNPRNGEVTITIPDRFQRHVKIHISRIFAVNPGQIRLIPQYSPGLGIETLVTIYLTTKNSQLPTMANSQTWFDSLQRTMNLMDYWDYAL